MSPAKLFWCLPKLLYLNFLFPSLDPLRKPKNEVQSSKRKRFFLICKGPNCGICSIFVAEANFVLDIW